MSHGLLPEATRYKHLFRCQSERKQREKEEEERCAEHWSNEETRRKINWNSDVLLHDRMTPLTIFNYPRLVPLMEIREVSPLTSKTFSGDLWFSWTQLPWNSICLIGIRLYPGSPTLKTQHPHIFLCIFYRKYLCICVLLCCGNIGNSDMRGIRRCRIEYCKKDDSYHFHGWR